MKKILTEKKSSRRAGVLSVLLVLAGTVFAFTGCGRNKTEETIPAETASAESSAETPSAEAVTDEDISSETTGSSASDTKVLPGGEFSGLLTESVQGEKDQYFTVELDGAERTPVRLRIVEIPQYDLSKAFPYYTESKVLFEAEKLIEADGILKAENITAFGITEYYDAYGSAGITDPRMQQAYRNLQLFPETALHEAENLLLEAREETADGGIRILWTLNNETDNDITVDPGFYLAGCDPYGPLDEYGHLSGKGKDIWHEFGSAEETRKPDPSSGPSLLPAHSSLSGEEFIETD